MAKAATTDLFIKTCCFQVNTAKSNSPENLLERLTHTAINSFTYTQIYNSQHWTNLSLSYGTTVTNYNSM